MSGGDQQITSTATGLAQCHAPDPCVAVIFGASGDLTRRELIPSLYELFREGLLPEPFAVVGFARQEVSDEEFRQAMRKAVGATGSAGGRWGDFARSLYYVTGNFNADAGDDYTRLAQKIARVRDERGIPDNVFFHLATPAGFFGTIAERLAGCGLAHSEDGWRRLVIEKPFGENRASARELDRQLRSVFEEEQIYRIDHFLGKETVQNMLVFRFANPSFEPIWNWHFIDHVQITVAEDIGIGTRAGFYESTGVVRDMVQNHLLQLLGMVAIDPPLRFDGPSLRDETVKVLRAVQPPGPEGWVRGQYDAGTVNGESVRAYRDEDHVDDASATATFAAVRLTIDNWRWAGVPFYLRTGKRLGRKLTEVTVHFKPTPHLMFPSAGREPTQCHILTFRLQPEEGILQTFVAKQPGPEIALTPVTSRFLYAETFGVKEPPRAYAWLLHDVIQGDQTLFARSDWIDQAWSIVDPIVSRWEETPPEDFPNYEAGSMGPDAAVKLIAGDGRTWDD